MKKEIADLWVAALRSGEYTQGQHRLETIDADGSRFCCLGVLCQLAIANGVEVIREVELNADLDERASYNGVYAVPDETVIEWAGMKTRNPSFDGANNLVDLNDSGKTFEEIADVIEQNWSTL